MSSATAPRRCGKRRRAVMASASDAGTRRARRGQPVRRRKFYCARRCVRLSTTWHDTFLEAPVRVGAFLFRELLLSRVIEARADCGCDGRSVFRRAIALDDGGL